VDPDKQQIENSEREVSGKEHNSGIVVIDHSSADVEAGDRSRVHAGCNEVVVRERNLLAPSKFA